MTNWLLSDRFCYPFLDSKSASIIEALNSSCELKWLISDLIPKKSEKFEFWKNYFFIVINVKLTFHAAHQKKFFYLWIKSYEAYSILRTSEILEYLIFKFMTVKPKFF